MKKVTFLAAIAAVLLVGSPAAKAANLNLSAVVPLDTFTFDLIGISFDTTTGAVSSAAYLFTPGTATFGLATTVTGPNGQVITMTSSETVGVTTTTDTFTLSTPVNFLTTTTFGGNFINGLQFDVGTANSGGNPVSVFPSITTYTATGGVTYGPTSTLTASLSPTTQLAVGGASYAFAEGVNASPLTTSASAYAFRTFTYSISYPTIPEPSTWAMLGLGTIAGAVVIRRRRLAV